MSHELRTPMHGILSYAAFGIAKFDKVPPHRIKGYFSEIKDSAQHLMLLLNDLLDLSKLESQLEVINSESFDIYKIIINANNILFFNGKKWLTPEKPLLKGIQRQFLLNNEIIETANISPNDLHNFTKARLVNAMIGFEDMLDISIAEIQNK